jgi:hypothetical protein
MPPLQFCGRKWNIASDDLFFPSVCGLAIRVAWLTIFIFASVNVQGNLDQLHPLDALYFQSYLYGSTGVVLFCVSLEIAIAVISLRVRANLCTRKADAAGNCDESETPRERQAATDSAFDSQCDRAWSCCVRHLLELLRDSGKQARFVFVFAFPSCSLAH